MLNRKNIKLVIVEDDKYYNKMLTRYVENLCKRDKHSNLDFEIESYTSAHECIENLENDTDFMILDYYLENEEEEDVLNAEDIIQEANIHCPECKIIVISAMKDAHKAKELIRSGIYEYIDKNVNTTNRVGAILQKALEHVAA